MKFIISSLGRYYAGRNISRMRAKKPQTRRTGGSLVAAQNSTPKKPSASLIAKQRLLAASKNKAVTATAIKKTVKSSTTSATAANKATTGDTQTNKPDTIVTKKDVVSDKKAKISVKSKIGVNAGGNSQNVVASKKETNAKRTAAGVKNSKTVNAKAKLAAAVGKKEDKNLKSSKELKNLDIQICGFNESESSELDSGQTIKASISEIVKTKSRAATTTSSSPGSCAASPVPTPISLPKLTSAATKPSTAAMEANGAEQSGAKKDSVFTEKTDEKSKKSSGEKKRVPAKEAKEHKEVIAVDNSAIKKAANKKVRAKKAALVKPEVKVKQPAKKPTTATKKDNIKKTKEFPVDPKAGEEKNEKKQQSQLDANASTTKSIEIKTDESKSLIDTISDAINEVVKQYQDSAMCEANAAATEPESNLSVRPKIAKPKSAAGKVVKAPKKKPLSKDTLSAIKGASENLAKEVEKIANVVKRPLAKRPPKKTLKAIAVDVKPSDDKTNVVEMAEQPSKATELAKKSDDAKKSHEDQLTAQKPKKKAVGSAKRTMAKKNESIATPHEKSGNDTVAVDAPASKVEQKSDDDDNMSLTKLKATLSQSKSSNKKFAKNKSPPKKRSKEVAAVKSTLIAPKIKQKYLKKNQKKAAIVSKAAAACDSNKQKADIIKEKSSTANGDVKATKDIYDFHESGHSSEDALSCYKKKKESTASSSFADKLDSQKNSFAGKTDGILAKNKASPSKKMKPPNVKKKAPSPPKKIAKLPPVKKIVSTQPTTHRNKDVEDDEESHVSSDNSDSSYSDGENERQMKRQKMRQKKRQNNNPPNLSQSKRMPQSRSASSNASTDADDPDDESDDDDNAAKQSAGSDTSVKTRVNNRRKLAAKNRRLKLFGFYSGPKRHRMASLNALAKVQCLYENESRTAQELGFVKEPRIAPKEVRLLSDGPSTSTHAETVTAAKNEPPDPKKEKRAKVDASELVARGDDEKKEMTSNRTLRNVPGLRGAGLLWEMEGSSMDDESDIDDKQVSSMSSFFIFSFFIIFQILIGWVIF